MEQQAPQFCLGWQENRKAGCFPRLSYPLALALGSILRSE